MVTVKDSQASLTATTGDNTISLVGVLPFHFPSHFLAFLIAFKVAELCALSIDCVPRTNGHVKASVGRQRGENNREREFKAG